MHAVAERSRLDPVIDAIYDTALLPEAWPALLERLAVIFNAGFADIFSRTDDRSFASGVAFGLDTGDYEEMFLGHWFQRNVWRQNRPVSVTGEVIQTREMVPAEVLMQSEIFNDFLAERDLHEGLRLAIHAGEGSIQALSLLRPFSIGPYTPGEIEMARTLMPHLLRAAAVARRLGETDAMRQSSLAAFDNIDKPVFLLDGAGRVVHQNQMADSLLSRGDTVFLSNRTLSAATPAATQSLAAALSSAASGPSASRAAGSVSLPRPGQRPPVVMTTVPLSLRADWAMARPPMAMAFISDPQGPGPLTTARLMKMFQLTLAEAELALDLLAGHGIAAIAESRRRSVNTVRTHLRNLMSKTQTHRQVDLVRLLLNLCP